MRKGNRSVAERWGFFLFFSFVGRMAIIQHCVIVKILPIERRVALTCQGQNKKTRNL
jgi:hypothetical protein